MPIDYIRYNNKTKFETNRINQNVNYNNKGTIKLYGMYIRDILNEQEKTLKKN